MLSSNLPLGVAPGVAVDYTPMAVISTERQGTSPISVPVSASIPAPRQLGSVGSPGTENPLTVGTCIHSRLSSLTTTTPLANCEPTNVYPARRSQYTHVKTNNYYGQHCQSSSVNANIIINSCIFLSGPICPR